MEIISFAFRQICTDKCPRTHFLGRNFLGQIDSDKVLLREGWREGWRGKRSRLRVNFWNPITLQVVLSKTIIIQAGITTLNPTLNVNPRHEGCVSSWEALEGWRLWNSRRGAEWERTSHSESCASGRPENSFQRIQEVRCAADWFLIEGALHK